MLHSNHMILLLSVFDSMYSSIRLLFLLRPEPILIINSNHICTKYVSYLFVDDPQLVPQAASEPQQLFAMLQA